jgi:hypothetical protein
MFFFTPLRLIASLMGLIVIGVPTAAIVFFLLAVAGSPGTCESREQPVAVTDEFAASFQAKWDQLEATLDSGQPSTFVFTQDEATSRARQWVEEHDAPVSDLLICFRTGDGSASAKIDVPFLPGDVDVLVHGTLILTGDRPEAEIDDLEIGGMPSFLSDMTKGFINGLIDDEAEKILLGHDYGLAFGEGEATISGQP